MTLPQLSAALSIHILDLCERFLSNGRRSGNRWIVGDIRNTKGDSCNVELDGPKQGFWFDHAANEGGDPISLVAQAQGISIGQAAKWAREYLNIPDEKPRFDPLTKPWKKDDQWVHGSVAWHYPEADAYVVRFNLPNGKKDNIPLRFLPPDGETPDRTNQKHWRWKGWTHPEPKPIYRIGELDRKPDAPVLIVEGEKDATNLDKLGFLATCNSGGAGSSRAGASTIRPPYSPWASWGRPPREKATAIASQRSLSGSPLCPFT